MMHPDDDWLLAKKPDAIWVDVTPDMATRWLDYGLLDRKVMKHHVRNLSRDMLSRRFYPVPDGVAFDSFGMRINGQHRLSAIVEAGIPVGVFVFVGLPIEAREVTDTGKKSRTLMHAFQMRGIETDESQKRICEVANAMMDVDGQNRRTTLESLDFAEKHLDVIEDAIRGIKSGPLSKKTATLAVIARALFGADREDRGVVGRICSVLESGISSDEDEQEIIRLRDFMMKPLGGGRSERLAMMNRMAKVIAKHMGRRVRRDSTCADLFPLSRCGL